MARTSYFASTESSQLVTPPGMDARFPSTAQLQDVRRALTPQSKTFSGDAASSFGIPQVAQQTTPPASVPRVVCGCGTVLLFPRGTTVRSCWKCGNEAQYPMISTSPELPAPTQYYRLDCDESSKRSPSSSAPPSDAPSPKFTTEARGDGKGPRRTCPCGTVLIFPGQTSVRRCGRCGTVTHLDPFGERFGEDMSTPGFGSPMSPVRSSSAPAQVALAPMASVSEVMPTEFQGARGHQARFLKVEDYPSPSRYFSARVGVLLIAMASVAANFVLLAERARTEGGGIRMTGQDVDFDGVPDDMDRCNVHTVHREKTSRGWTSQVANDFDGDGCMDNVEDRDKDNDGIEDDRDKCPMTPQHFAFVSTRVSDFDGDGCADSLEDDDNDGDAVLNSYDDCPRTVLGHQTNVTGCSLVQRKYSEQDEDPKWWELTSGFGRYPHQQMVLNSIAGNDFMPWWEDWYNFLRGTWVELILGGVLTAVLTKLHQTTARLHNQLVAGAEVLVSADQPPAPIVAD